MEATTNNPLTDYKSLYENTLKELEAYRINKTKEPTNTIATSSAMPDSYYKNLYENTLKELETYKNKPIFNSRLSKTTKPMPPEPKNIIDMQKLAINNYGAYKRIMNEKQKRNKKNDNYNY